MKINAKEQHRCRALGLGLFLILSAVCIAGEELDDWVSFSANLDGSYRSTQFFEENHAAWVGQWDSRLEIWLPPHREHLSFGPYIRFAGIAATEKPAWENALLAGPGFGGQVYPFSLSFLHRGDNTPWPVFYSVKTRSLDSERVATTAEPLGTTFSAVVVADS